MSVNTAHANNGVLIHAGEYILLHSDNVSMEFSGQDNPIFKGTKVGRIYLTSHRMIFNHKKSSDPMQSFSAPFIAMNDVELEQPVFGANYIKGKVRAQPNGNFIGEVKFKLYFKSGGAIEYGMALLRAARTAQSNMRNGGYGDDPPPYTPSGNWYEAPPPAYAPPPGYYGWLPQHEAFSGPAPNTVFMSDNPPPYPGIGGPPPYSAQPPAPVYQPQHYQQYPQPPQPQNQPPPPQQQQPQPQQQPQQEEISWNGFSLPPPEQPPQTQQHMSGNQAQQQEEISWNGFSLPPPEQPQQQRTQQQQQSSAPQAGWNSGGGAGAGGYPQSPPYGVAPPYGAYGAPYPPQQPGYPPYPGYPPAAGYPPYPPAGYPQYPPPGGATAGAMGFNGPPANY